MMRYRRRAFLSALLFAAAACASAANRQESATSDVISRAELDAAGSVTAYDAVQRLRPGFLHDRGPVSLLNANARTRPAVFIDMTEYGEVESLRSLSASRVEQVRYYPGQQAVTRFGSAYGAGVIQLTMRTH